MEDLSGNDEGGDPADELVALFGKITTNDRETLVEQFSRVLQVDTGVAQFFLEASSWNVETAVHAYLNSTGDSGGPTTLSSRGEGNVEPPLVLLERTPLAAFVSDLSTLSQPVAPGTTIDMQWVFRNVGEDAWPENSRLVFVEGESMSGRTTFNVPSTQPQTDVVVHQRIRAPMDEGTHTGIWRLVSPAGYFGDPLWIIIQTQASRLNVGGGNGLNSDDMEL